MRWKGLIFLVVLIGLFFVLSLIFTDAWLESKIEDIGTSIVGAKVEIDDFDLSLTGLRLAWTRLQITNPKQTMRNMLETGKAEIDLEFLPLFADKIIVESIMLTEVRTNTERETDGRIERRPTKKIENYVSGTINRLNQQVSATITSRLGDAGKKVNVDSILKILDIRSLDKMTRLQSDLDASYKKWTSDLNNLDVSSQAKQIEVKIKTVDINKAKTVEGYQATLNELNSIQTSIESLENSYGDLRDNLEKDIVNTGSQLSQIDDWISEDFARALEMAKLPEINAQSIGKLIFGKKLVDQVNQYLSYVAIAREYASLAAGDKPEKEDPPRLKGQTIIFPSRENRPDLWIKKIVLSGETEDKIKLAGDVSDIVSDQKLIGKPTLINVSGGKTGKINVSFNGILNYLMEQPSESFTIDYAGFSLANTRLSDLDFLPNKISTGTGGIRANIELKTESIDGQISFKGSQIKFAQDAIAQSDNKLKQILRSVFKDISLVTFDARISGKKDDLRFSLHSNLDDILVQKMKGVLGKEISAAKQKIKQELEQKIQTKRREVEELAETQKQKILAELEKYKKEVQQAEKQFEEKKQEVEKIFEKEKSKLQDKVKDLFKF